MELWPDPADLRPNPCEADNITYSWAYASKLDENPDGAGDAEFLPAVPTEVPPAGYFFDGTD